jgi:hypothetical protein
MIRRGFNVFWIKRVYCEKANDEVASTLLVTCAESQPFRRTSLASGLHTQTAAGITSGLLTTHSLYA